MKCKVYTFIVRGGGLFPLDMLRYDACWPGDSDAVIKLDEDRQPRTVKLISHREPTVDRWASFGWLVER